MRGRISSQVEQPVSSGDTFATTQAALARSGLYLSVRTRGLEHGDGAMCVSEFVMHDGHLAHQVTSPRTGATGAELDKQLDKMARAVRAKANPTIWDRVVNRVVRIGRGISLAASIVWGAITGSDDA